MKNFLIKAVMSLVLLVILEVLFNAISTPLDNSMALTQLDDSNASLALYDTYLAYGAYLQFALSALVVGAIFFVDIKKLFGGNADEKK